MAYVKEHQITRFLIACTVVPAVSIREDWTRAMFEKLQDEFPELLGTPLIVRDQLATFLRPVGETGTPAAICRIARDSLVVGTEPPTPDDLAVLPGFALRLFEVAREAYHIKRVSRIGRVEVAAWVLDGNNDTAPQAIRAALTKLDATEASEVEVQFTRREGPYNVNLKLSAGSSSPETGPTGLPARDIVVTQSDVNNWDMHLDVTREMADGILARGERHAREEVAAFLHDRMGLQVSKEEKT